MKNELGEKSCEIQGGEPEMAVIMMIAKNLTVITINSGEFVLLPPSFTTKFKPA